jgi:hypothetical protein
LDRDPSGEFDCSYKVDENFAVENVTKCSDLLPGRTEFMPHKTDDAEGNRG